ncbi:MAG: hydrogenase iron-sulfur subunit [Proteobacteria bacterium]|nr:hydrogenase iron-sulfur subunit [Pseudomonadota bacterium]
MNDSFKPRILAFLCNWCSYAGADLAGVSRIQYPPSIRVVRTMCSGRVDPLFVIEALKDGFDGVFIGGCHLGDCHYQDGNVYTLRRMDMLAQLLDISGIGRNRVHLRWASAAEAQTFADYVIEVTEVITTMGPFDKTRYSLQLAALERGLTSPRLRWLVGIDRQVTERENVYHEKTDPEQFKKVLQNAIETEYQKALIYELLNQGPVTVKEMSEKSGLPVYTISLRLNDLERGGLAALSGCEGRTPKFVSAAS